MMGPPGFELELSCGVSEAGARRRNPEQSEGLSVFGCLVGPLGFEPRTNRL